MVCGPPITLEKMESVTSVMPTRYFSSMITRV